MRWLVVVLLIASLAALHWLAGSDESPSAPGTRLGASIPPRPGTLSAGQAYAVALDTRGVAYLWGGADSYRGAFRFSASGLPAPIVDGSGYRSVSAGNDSLLLIDAEGGLRRIGLENLSRGERTPLRLFAPRRFVQAHESWGSGVAIDSGGGLWWWDDRELADRIRRGDASVEPRQFQPDTRFVDACIQATRLHAVDDAGRLWRSHELKRSGLREGQPLQGTRTELEPVAADARLLNVRCRENAQQVIALDDSGRLWSYGSGQFGESGLGSPDDDRFGTDRAVAYNATALQPIDSGGTRFAEVAVTKDATLAIATDGTLWGFGRNMDHELGLRDGTSHDRPTPIEPGRLWVAVAGTFGGGVAIAVDGSLHAWGLNVMGVLGDGGVARAHQVPQPVLTDIRFGGRE